MTQPVLICGGAGFVGTNVAARLLSSGRRVLVYDDLSRPGVEHNLDWLRSEYGPLLDFELADIRDAKMLKRAVRSASAVFHFGAQTAVTTSLVRPKDDFDINARGTLTLLEELRALRQPIPLVFTSTNKVYGNLEKLALRLVASRYEPQHPGVASTGISEKWSLDFHSPYGCSKGAADQYVLDYARSYGLPNVVFRMSCIYGPHQCGTEDQGWVAHFLIRALQNEPITIYGDGCQVRDVLFVEDLVDALMLAHDNAGRLAGTAFNIGGGIARTTSLLELIEMIRITCGLEPRVRFEDWRVGDQRYYVSDTGAFQRATGWRPQVSVSDGVRRLRNWLCSSPVSQSAAQILRRGVA
jgi:CDP-paratose 2-epimerase